VEEEKWEKIEALYYKKVTQKSVDVNNRQQSTGEPKAEASGAESRRGNVF